jgi:hypothetical protein
MKLTIRCGGEVISWGYCPVCGRFTTTFGVSNHSIECNWESIGELLDTYEEYLNKKRFNKIKEVLLEDTYLG